LLISKLVRDQETILLGRVVFALQIMSGKNIENRRLQTEVEILKTYSAERLRENY
jgi:hypothetical protein